MDTSQAPSETPRRWWDRRWARWARAVLLVVVVVVAVRTWQTRNAASGAAPALAAVGVNGRSLSLSDFHGEPVLVHFWATWCGVCKVEESNIMAIAADSRVVTIAVRSGSDAEVRSYADASDLSMPIVNDPDGALSQRWGVGAFPTSFILDAAGQIRFVEVGYSTTWGLRARLALARWLGP